MSPISHSITKKRRADNGSLLRPSAITLAFFSAFLSVSQNATAACATGGNITITADCTGDITATALRIEGADAYSTATVTGNVFGTPGNFANNTLTLRTPVDGYWWYEASYMPAITGNISNFGTITVDHRGEDFYPDLGHYLNAPLDAAFGNIDTSGGAVKLNFLSDSGLGDAGRFFFRITSDITGSGGLTVSVLNTTDFADYANVLILGGNNNTYTGQTTINQGILKIGDGTNFSFGANNNVHLDPDAGKVEFQHNSVGLAPSYFAGVIFDTAGQNFTYDGVISGNAFAQGSANAANAVAFTKAGPGTMTLLQDQTYIGNTQVTSGTLQIGSGGTSGMIGQGILWIDSGATAILDRSDDLAMPLLWIYGTLTKKNDTTLTVSDLDGNGGTLNIDGGTVRITPDKTLTLGAVAVGSSLQAVNLADDTKLIVDADTIGSATGVRRKYIFTLGRNGGTISGNGQLIKEGEGTLILRSNAQHTGGTIVEAGTFQVGDNSASAANISGSVELNTGTTLVFSPWTDISSNANISGEGDLIKGGYSISSSTYDLSTLTLTGNLTHTGKTEVLTGGLTLSGSTKLDTTSALILHDGTTFTATDTAQNLNRLEVNGTATYAGNFHAKVMDFHLLGEHLDPVANPNFVALNVTGGVDIGGSTINVMIDGAAPGLRIGDSVTLFKTTTGITGTPANDYTQHYGEGGMQGALISYGFDLAPCNGTDYCGIVSDAKIREESKSILQGHLAGMAALVRSGDFLASHGINAARQQLSRVYDEGQKIPEKGLWNTGIQPFVAHSGGLVRHETGSHIKTQGYNFLAGAVSGLRAPSGKVLAGAFFEYGKAEFDAYNAFNQKSVTGDGDTHHRGLGLFGRVEMDNGLYTEASLRAGKVDTVFQSDFLKDYFGTRASYTSNTRYTGAHATLGKLWPLSGISEKLSVDTYSQALWTRQSGDTVQLSTGEELEFDGVTSTRLKLGARVRYDVSNNTAFYGGFAYDHEFSAKAKAKLVNFGNTELPSSKLLGGTGMLEAGLLLTPSAYSPISVDLGVQGFTGRREGIVGSLRLNYYF